MEVCKECWEEGSGVPGDEGQGQDLSPLLCNILPPLPPQMPARKGPGYGGPKSWESTGALAGMKQAGVKHVLQGCRAAVEKMHTRTSRKGLPWWSPSSPRKGARVRSLVKELDPTCCN